MEAKSVNYRAKSEPKKLPEGAVVIGKELSVNVEEIENGFLITKEFSIEYTLEDEMEHMWETKKTYSKTNPLKGMELEIKDSTKTETLADKF